MRTGRDHRTRTRTTRMRVSARQTQRTQHAARHVGGGLRVCGVRTDGHRVGLGLRGYFPPALVLPVALVESSRVQAVEMIPHLHTHPIKIAQDTHVSMYLTIMHGPWLPIFDDRDFDDLCRSNFLFC